LSQWHVLCPNRECPFEIWGREFMFYVFNQSERDFYTNVAPFFCTPPLALSFPPASSPHPRTLRLAHPSESAQPLHLTPLHPKHFSTPRLRGLAGQVPTPSPYTQPSHFLSPTGPLPCRYVQRQSRPCPALNRPSPSTVPAPFTVIVGVRV
jgi:hypothetical protein